MSLGNHPFKQCGLSLQPIRMAAKQMNKQKNLTIPNADKNVEEQQELSFLVGGDAKRCSHFKRRFGIFLTRLNIVLAHDPVIPLLSVQPNELKTTLT